MASPSLAGPGTASRSSAPPPQLFYCKPSSPGPSTQTNRELPSLVVFSWGYPNINMSVPSPKSTLLEGAEILEKVLAPKDFHFRFHGEGKGSGGTFAWGEFVRGNRRLELHVRFNLGLVRYHVGKESASHDYYMRELSVREQCHYPDFSEQPKEAFLGLAHDLAFAGDFLTGTAALLRQAAMRESSEDAARDADLMAGYVGDKRKIEHLRSCFRQGKYEDALADFKSLKYPGRLSESDRKMVELARKRTLVS